MFFIQWKHFTIPSTWSNGSAIPLAGISLFGENKQTGFGKFSFAARPGQRNRFPFLLFCDYDEVATTAAAACLCYCLS